MQRRALIHKKPTFCKTNLFGNPRFVFRSYYYSYSIYACSSDATAGRREVPGTKGRHEKKPAAQPAAAPLPAAGGGGDVSVAGRIPCTALQCRSLKAQGRTLDNFSITAHTGRYVFWIYRGRRHQGQVFDAERRSHGQAGDVRCRIDFGCYARADLHWYQPCFKCGCDGRTKCCSTRFRLRVWYRCKRYCQCHVLVVPPAVNTAAPAYPQRRAPREFFP